MAPGGGGRRGRRVRSCAVAAALLAAAACLALLPPAGPPVPALLLTAPAPAPPPTPSPSPSPAPAPALRTVVAYSLQRLLAAEPRAPLRCPAPAPAPPPPSAAAPRQGWASLRDAPLHLFSAHLDRRLPGYPYVRVVAMIQGRSRPALFCQLRYSGAEGAGAGAEEAQVLEALSTDIWADGWDEGGGPDADTAFRPLLLSCPLPPSDAPAPALAPRPVAVAVARQPCQLSDAQLALPPPRPAGPGPPHAPAGRRRGEFAVCVKGLDFPEEEDGAAAAGAGADVSLRLVEWLELNLLLGAQHFFVYVLAVGGRARRVLRHYAARGVLTALPLALPPGQPNDARTRSRFLRAHTWQRRRHELVPYNDCLYRNLDAFRFVVPLDIDEVIVPVEGRTWGDIFRRLEAEEPGALQRYASFSVRNAYFFDSFGASAPAPPFLHTLRHTTRSANFSPEEDSVKSFVRTSAALTVFNHYALHPLTPGAPRALQLDTRLAQMNHYRAKCPPLARPGDCKNNYMKYKAVDDIVPKRFGKQLKARVMPVLKRLKLID